MNRDTEGCKWREVSQAVVSHAFKAAISHAAVKTTLILFFPLPRTFALFADEVSHIASLLALLVVCLAVSNQCAFMLAHTARGALQMLLSLTVKKQRRTTGFVSIGKVCSFPPPLPRRHEMSQCRHSVLTACLWLSLVNCFCFTISCERKEESFPVVKKLGKDCHCVRCLNFPGLYL